MQPVCTHQQVNPLLAAVAQRRGYAVGVLFDVGNGGGEPDVDPVARTAVPALSQCLEQGRLEIAPQDGERLLTEHRLLCLDRHHGLLATRVVHIEQVCGRGLKLPQRRQQPKLVGSSVAEAGEADDVPAAAQT